MEAIAFSAAALLAAAAAVFAALPFLRSGAAPKDGGDRLLRRRNALLEQRDRALAALSELEFDYRTGKLVDCDYRLLTGTLRGQAAEALRLIEPQPSPSVERRLGRKHRIHSRQPVGPRGGR